MSLKVIGAGFGRTGTTSLQAALEELGFDKCYHMRETFKNPSHAPFWIDVIGGKEVDWKTFFKGYQSTVDWPGCTYYKELMAQYPNAKVLLSVRDPDRWYESTKATIYPITTSLFMKMLGLIAPHMRTMYPALTGAIWQGTFQDRFEDKAFAIDTFNRHNEEVKAYVPAERLLVYDVKEGWEPLCRFLDVGVPTNKPFPNLNDRKVMQRAMRWGPAGILGILVGLIGLLVWFVMVFVG